MAYTEKHDKPKEYPYGYLLHHYDGAISPLNKYGYVGGETDATLTVKYLMFIIFCLLIICGGFLIL